MRIGVMQPLPGIGDMMWLLPALKAIAASAPAGKITLFVKPSAQADKLLAAETWVNDIVLLPNGRGLPGLMGNFIDTWKALRGARLDRLYILHQSLRYRLAAQVSGIPEILAYPASLARSKDNGWIKSLAFLAGLGLSVPDSTSHLHPRPDIITSIRQRFQNAPQPWFIISPGASEAFRCWPPERFAACADAIHDHLGGTIFLTGRASEADRVKAVQSLCRQATSTLPVVDLALDELMGLLSCSVGLLGNDSGAGNVAAALGRPAFMLCGVSLPGMHSPNLFLITPDLAPGEIASMESISVRQVMDFIKPHLQKLATPAA